MLKFSVKEMPDAQLTFQTDETPILGANVIVVFCNSTLFVAVEVASKFLNTTLSSNH